MANPKTRRLWPLWAFLAIVAVGAAGLWFSSYGERVRGDALAGSAYGARVACSCRFVAGRSMADCRKDKLAGMGMIRLTDDAAARSVTASVPFLASETARLRDGYGCMLDRWERAERS